MALNVAVRCARLQLTADTHPHQCVVLSAQMKVIDMQQHVD
jgi:hypothetical protein